MTFETERLILRPWKESDAEDLYRVAKDTRIGPAAGRLPHTDVEDSREIIRTVLSEDETYAVCLKENNKAIGSIGLMIGNRSNLGLTVREGEIGYWIGVPFWGQGLIPEATREIIRRAFADLRLETLWCGYFDGNERSKRVQEKCGFVYHHTNRNIYWKQTDDVRTEHITRLKRTDWLNSIRIRGLSEEEIPKALALAWKVFSEFESPAYSAEGTEEFRKTLYNEEYLTGIDYYGAFDGNRLIGEIGIRRERKHICFFFVDGRYHRLGIGTRLFRYLLNDFPDVEITLNSSPYGLPFYNAIGFSPTEEEKTVNGIRFTPMRYDGREGTG